MGLKVASDSLGAVSAHDLLHYGTTGRASDALVIPTGVPGVNYPELSATTIVSGAVGR